MPSSGAQSPVKKKRNQPLPLIITNPRILLLVGLNSEAEGEGGEGGAVQVEEVPDLVVHLEVVIPEPTGTSHAPMTAQAFPLLLHGVPHLFPTIRKNQH